MAKRGKQPSVRVLKKRVVYRGPVFYVTSEIVQEPGGVRVRRDVVRHPGSVVILAVDDSSGEPRVLLERQYRYAAGQRLWELPAGRIDEGESALAAAKRELREETGFRARRWTRAMFFWVSPGFLDETMAIYLARDLEHGADEPEDDEVIAKRFFSLPAAVRMAVNGTIRDGKTIAAVLWLRQRLADGKKSRTSGK
jgi:ADP-ribose pyrophosphatase